MTAVLTKRPVLMDVLRNQRLKRVTEDMERPRPTTSSMHKMISQVFAPDAPVIDSPYHCTVTARRSAVIILTGAIAGTEKTRGFGGRRLGPAATDRTAARGAGQGLSDGHRARTGSVVGVGTDRSLWNSQVAPSSTSIYQHRRHVVEFNHL